MNIIHRIEIEDRIDQAIAIISVCTDAVSEKNEHVQTALWAATERLEEAVSLLVEHYADSEDNSTGDDNSMNIDDEEEENVDEKPHYWWDLAFTPVGSAATSLDLAFQDGDGEENGEGLDEEDDGDEEGTDDEAVEYTARFVILIDKE
jgi:hypothetical protein